MDSSYTIVVPDTEILGKICGANDSNLRLIEKHLGVPVFIKGNEISLSNSCDDTNEKFKHIMDRILDEAYEGAEPCCDMISAILQLPTEDNIQDEKAYFEQATIKIPNGLRSVYPKTITQAKLIHAFRNNSLTFAEGPAGSGKTYLAVAEAISQVLSQKKRSLILTRPVVEAGESLGFLPGDFEQKINPYLRPLFDSLESLIPKDLLLKMLESGIIEIAPLAYMRGRTLSDCIVLLDEAQNTTSQQMKMFLTRLGENSKVFITGDITQIDLPKRVPSGLVEAIQILQNIQDISICRLTGVDIVRSPLVQKIIQAYEKAENTE